MSSLHLDLRKKMQEILQLSLKDMEHKAYESLIRDELHQVTTEIFKILNKHGIQNVHDMDKWFQEGKIDEAEGWEDFFTLDALEYKQRELKAILKDL